MSFNVPAVFDGITGNSVSTHCRGGTSEFLRASETYERSNSVRNNVFLSRAELLVESRTGWNHDCMPHNS